jgi:hypothetical protein
VVREKVIKRSYENPPRETRKTIISKIRSRRGRETRN